MLRAVLRYFVSSALAVVLAALAGLLLNVAAVVGVVAYPFIALLKRTTKRG